MARVLIATLASAALIGCASAALGQPAAPNAATYEMETLSTGPLPPAVMRKLGPLHTLQAVEDLLKQNDVPFRWAHREVEPATLSPAPTASFDTVPPHEVFVLMQGEGFLFGVILSKH